MAKKETSEILYSLSESPCWIAYESKGKNGVKHNPEYIPKHEYDLLNWAVIQSDKTIKQGSHEFYDTKFKEEINRLPKRKVKLFLEHHFEKTYSKTGLINRIEKYILIEFRTSLNDKLLNEDKADIVAEWLLEKKKELPKIKPQKEGKPKQLCDFFESDSSFKKGLSAIEKVILDKHKNFRRGKGNNIATTFLLFRNKKLIKKGSDQLPFSKALAIHYGGSFANGSVTKGAYLEEIAIELEKHLE